MTALSILLLALAVVAYAITQLKMHDKLRWTDDNNPFGFWGDVSDRRKYKRVPNTEPMYRITGAKVNWYTKLFKIKYREAYLFSSNFLAWTTDGYHACQSIMFLSLSGSISIATGLNFFLVWLGVLTVHFITYRLLQR